MRDGKVNWSKFLQMGRSAAVVLDCARLAPSLPVDRGVARCILNVPLLDKDVSHSPPVTFISALITLYSVQRQYTLSYTYQPRASSTKPVSGTRARLRTLADRSPFF
jgi:hypothetical protein